MKKQPALPVLNIALIGVMTATLEAAKSALAFLPNVELVSLLIILYTLFFKKLILYVIPVFVLLEGCIYGFGLWWIMYLYTWPLLALLTHLFRRQKSPLFWSVLSGFFGLFYGALCAVPYIFLSGIRGAFAWWTAGIYFDLIHCVSNFTLCLILFVPLRNILKICKKALSQKAPQA